MKKLSVVSKKVVKKITLKSREYRKVSKLRDEIHALTASIEKDYYNLGKMVFTMAERDELDTEKVKQFSTEMKKAYEQISHIEKEIENIRADISRMLRERLCPSCGETLENEQKVCAKCGSPINGKDDKDVNVCPECHVEMDPDANFCSSCGYRTK